MDDLIVRTKLVELSRVVYPEAILPTDTMVQSMQARQGVHVGYEVCVSTYHAVTAFRAVSSPEIPFVSESPVSKV